VALLGWFVQPHVTLLLLLLLLRLWMHAGRSVYCCSGIVFVCSTTKTAVLANLSVLGGLRKPW
jgi:hypothetical protein